MTRFKLGRKARVTDSRTLLFSRYAAALPVLPASVDYTKGITDWGMMLNDSLGDCLAEDTLTVSPSISKTYRVLYDGPVINIVTGTGKRLTTTRNHPVLTSKGFLAAHLIKPGDYVLSSNFPQAIAARMNDNLQDAPSSIKDIFETHERIALPRAVKRKMSRAIDFHGDAKFFKSKVHIVNSDALLRSSYISTLRQPKPQFSLIPAVESTIAFNGIGSTFSHDHSILLPTPCSLGLSSIGLSLFGSHSSIAKKSRLAFSPYNASPMKKGVNSFPTDSELPGKLLRDFSTQIRLDNIVSVIDGSYKGHVYDASTNEQWYIANGIISHNCTIAAVGHAVQIFTLNTSGEITVPDQVIENYYQWWDGYVPGDPSTDQGGIPLAVLRSWRKHGFNGNKLKAFVSVDVSSATEIKQSIDLFGGGYIGLQVPNYVMQNLTAPGSTWDVDPSGDNGIAGGHAIWACGYHTDGSIIIISWGSIYYVTPAFWAANMDESYALLSPEWFTSKNISASGFNWGQLWQDLASL